MDWYKCKCGHVFNETEKTEREETDSSEAWGMRSITSTFIATCPLCDSDDLEDFSPCQTCIEKDDDYPNETLDGCDDCRECFEENDPAEFREYALKWLGESAGEPCNPAEVR